METKRISSKKIGLISAGVIAALILIYFGGFFYLKRYTLTSYEYLNCAESASSSQRLTQYFPDFLTRNVINNDFLAECQAFEAATTLFVQGKWDAAYNNYQVYLEKYPEGLFTGTAQKESQKALFEWAITLKDQGDFETAITKFDTLLEDENPFILDEDIQQIQLESYLGWVKALRVSSAYDQAIAKVEQIKSLSQNNYPEIETGAQVELAGVHLDWGKALLEEQNFETASGKLSEAMRLDPQPDLPSSPSQQAKAALTDLYIQWGDDVFAAKDYERALEYYRKSVEFSGNQNTLELQQAIANVYIDWANGFKEKEDFEEALNILKKSVQSDKIDDVKGLIDSATQETYLAFSKSSGKQALRAMKKAATAICSGEKPELPIFGLDSNQKLAYLVGGENDGVKEPLPESLAATTPGNMKYVACVTSRFDIEEKNIYSGASAGKKFSNSGSYNTPNWDISLRLADAGKVVNETSLHGLPPKGTSEDCTGFTTVTSSSISVRWVCIGYYPEFSKLVAWITDNIK